MACYRLRFATGRVFEVVIDRASVAGDTTTLCSAVIFRVTDDVREHQPLVRADGGPLQIMAVSEDMTLEIARTVLAEVTSSALNSIGKCGSRSNVPPLPGAGV